MLKGINHVTIAVSNLNRSIVYYTDILGMQLKVKWSKGAYLSLAGQWICLSLDDVCVNQDYSHLAFDIDEQHFEEFSRRLRDLGVKQWKQNKSEGKSLYILDPDDYQLEIHVGCLATRLQQMRKNQSSDIIFYDTSS